MRSTAFRTDRWLQVLHEVQDMHDDVLNMRVHAALNNNRLARMDSILVADKFAALLARADKLLARPLPGVEMDEAMQEAVS